MREKCEAVFGKCTATRKEYGFGINPSLLKTWFSKSVQAVPEKCEAVFRESTATSKKYGFGINPSALKTWFPESTQAVPEKCKAVFLNNIAIIRRSGFQKLLIVRFFSQIRSGIFGRVLTPIDC